MGERRDRGVGHGHRAEMAALGLRGHVEAGGAGDGAHARLVAGGVPDRGMQPGGDAPPHQGVIGRVELDQVDARRRWGRWVFSTGGDWLAMRPSSKVSGEPQVAPCAVS